MARLAPEKADFAPALPNQINKCGITCEVVIVEITIEEINSVLDADIENGILTWKQKTNKSQTKSNSESQLKRWNSTIAGTKAGYKKDGYLRVSLNGKQIYVHRILWFLANGYWPDVIDHINGDRSDNRQLNLRDVTHQENIKNSKKWSNNKSGVNGVSFDKSRNKWEAYTHIDCKKVSLGRFDNIEDAKLARQKSDKELKFSKTHGKRQCATT